MSGQFAGAVSGYALVGVLTLLSVVFAFRQWQDRRSRPDDLDEQDELYFLRQDQRRWLGSIVMLVIAAGMGAGLAIDPLADRDAGRLFVLIWSLVFVLVLVLLALALWDWFAIRSYAIRQRQAILDEARALAESRRRRHTTNGDIEP